MLENPPFEPVTHKCYGCAEMERLRETIPEGQKGVYVVIKPTEGETREIEQRLKEKEQYDLYESYEPKVDTYY